MQNSITLLLILNLAQNHTTHAIQNSVTNLTSHFSTTNLPPFLIFSPYNQLVLPAHLQLSLSTNAPSIPLGSKFLTNLPNFTFSYRLLPPYLLKLKQLKTYLCFIPIPLSLSHSTGPTPWNFDPAWRPVCHSLFIWYPSSSTHSSAQLVIIWCLS